MSKKTLFEKLTSSINDWKANYVVVNCPNGFSFRTVLSLPIRNKEAMLLDNNSAGLGKIYASMNSRNWHDLDTKDIVKR